MTDQKFECTYQVQDLIDAQNLHWLHSMLGFKLMRTVLLLGAALGLFYAGLAYLSGASGWNMFLAGAGGFGFVIVFIFVMAIVNRLFMIPRRQKKAFAQMKEFAGQSSFVISGQNLLFTTSRAQANLPFTDFVKWAENEKSFKLFRTDRLMHFIPIKAAPAEFVNALRANLTAAQVPAAAFWNS